VQGQDRGYRTRQIRHYLQKDRGHSQQHGFPRQGYDRQTEALAHIQYLQDLGSFAAFGYRQNNILTP